MSAFIALPKITGDFIGLYSIIKVGKNYLINVKVTKENVLMPLMYKCL